MPNVVPWIFPFCIIMPTRRVKVRGVGGGIQRRNMGFAD